jgi:hypothetical protein
LVLKRIFINREELGEALSRTSASKVEIPGVVRTSKHDNPYSIIGIDITIYKNRK